MMAVVNNGGSVRTPPPVWTSPAVPPPPLSNQIISPLPPATEGQFYSYTFAATGANRYVLVDRLAPPVQGMSIYIVPTPETYQPVGQAFPIGLSLNETTGVLSGIALTIGSIGGNVTAPTTSTFWIAALNVDQTTGRILSLQLRGLSLTVTPATGFDRTRPTWTTQPTPLGTYAEGQPMSVGVVATDPSSSVTYRQMGPWAISGVANRGGRPVPGTMSGIVVSSSGVISGTPIVSHDVTATTTIRAQNSRGLFRDRNVSIFITNNRQPPVWITPAGVLATGRRGHPLTYANYTSPGTTTIRSMRDIEAVPDFRGFGIRYRIISGNPPLGMRPITRTTPAQTAVTDQITRAVTTLVESRTYLEMSGTPNARAKPGTYTFTVRCEYLSDSNLNFVDRTFSIVLTI